MGLQEKWIVFVFIIEPFLFHVCQCLITYGSSSTTPAWTPPTWSWDPDCGEHWVKDSTSGRCYQFSNTSLTWNQAQAQCQNLGAGSQLVSINSPEEQYFVQKFLWGFTTPGLWIGVNTLNTGIGYHWSDGSPFSFLNWSPGEPNNVLNIEHCGEMVTDGYTWGKWNDNNCASQRGYICEKPSPGLTTVPTAPVPPTPGGYFYGCPGTQWLPYRRNCYLFNTPGTGWSNATQYCALQGSKLASIADENEQNFVLSQVPGTTDDSQYWIGFNDILTEMNFMWSDGSPVRYTNWAENEPNNYRQSEDCVGMYLKDGTWIDENCKLSLSGFICKAPKKLLKIGTPQHNPGTGCSVRNSLALGYNCYIVKESPKTWSAAQIYCKAYGGNLAVIQDRYQQAFLASQIAGGSGDYWIGLSNGGNTTVTGEALQFTAWSSNYTKSSDTARQASTCIAMKTERPGVGLWVRGNCALANRFICQYLRTGFSTRSTTPAPTTMSPVCPSSWHLYSGYCYKAYNQESDYRTWWEARDFCKAQGADLISLHSRAEENFAFAYPVTTNYQYQYHHGSYSYDTNKVYWIGASDFDVEKGFKWSDGSNWAYTNWKAGEPNDASGDDDCVERYQSSQNWNDNNCYTARPFICKIQLGQQLKTLPPTVASTASASCAGTPGWLPFNGSCYYISQQATTYTAMRKTWFDARLFCMKHGGDLPSIHSEQENGFITTLVSRKDLNSWFGLTLLGAGSYGWSDGTVLDYEKWMPGEPSKGNEKCGMMFAFNGYWNDVDCNQLYYFVCKRPMGTVQAHTPSPTPLIAGGCPQGFTGVHKNNKCYKVFGSLPADRKNYTFAKEHCKLIGDDLASMSSHIELATVITLLQGVFLDNSAVWIGMTDLTHSRRFTWDDSSPLYITNWAKGQPGYGWQDHCVEMYTGERQVGKWANAHCGNFKGYVCEATRKTIYPNSTPIPQGSCQTGYQQYSVGDCYKLHTTPKSWVQAKSSCETEGTSLISVLSVFEQAFVDILTADIATPVWLGLADQNHTGTFAWVDNWEVYYTSWGRNVPTHKTGEGCVSTQNGHWNDTVCANSYPYICKKSKLTPPPPTVSSGYCLDSTWKHFGGSCYYIALTMYKSWSESERDCKSRGMELASILSRTELLFILREIDYSPTTFTKDVWIGLLRHIDGHFIWSDGSSLNYLPWDDGQPSNTTSSEYNSGIHTYSSTREDCGEIKYTSGKLNDEKCSATNGYVCKTPQTPATSAPLSGATQPPAIIG